MLEMDTRFFYIYFSANRLAASLYASFLTYSTTSLLRYLMRSYRQSQFISNIHKFITDNNAEHFKIDERYYLISKITQINFIILFFEIY